MDGGNANYAWIQHFVHHLSPGGTAGFVLANGSMSTNTSGEGEIRKALIEADMVDCMIALPGQLFYTTQIPVCLWFITRSKKADTKRGFRNRQGETLFIDARKMGSLIDRTHRELSAEEIAEIARIYHAWRGEEKDGSYEDKPGFCKAATLDDIKSHHYVLTPGRYVGAEAVIDDGIPFEEKMAELSDTLYEQMRESIELDTVIRKNLECWVMGSNDNKHQLNRIESEVVAEDANRLVGDLKQLIDETRAGVAATVNAGLTMLYWKVGNRIRRDVLTCKRAGYGKEIVVTVARQLTLAYGRGFSVKSLRHMIRFAETFPEPEIVSAMMRQLSWTHFLSIIYIRYRVVIYASDPTFLDAVLAEEPGWRELTIPAMSMIVFRHEDLMEFSREPIEFIAQGKRRKAP